jgi:hypothetical protein
MGAPPAEPALDPYDELFGVYVSQDRLTENLASFRAIWTEIAKLRELDLTEVQPAVIFEPLAVYRRTAKR